MGDMTVQSGHFNTGNWQTKHKATFFLVLWLCDFSLFFLVLGTTKAPLFYVFAAC